MTPDQQPIITVAGNVALREFVLQDRKKNPVAALKRLDVVMTALEPLQSKFHFAKIALDSPELNVRRDKSGTINLLTLAPQKKEEPKPAKAEAKTEEKPLPTLILDEFDLKNGKIAYRDEVPQEPINSLIQDITRQGGKDLHGQGQPGQAVGLDGLQQRQGFHRRERARWSQPRLRQSRCRPETGPDPTLPGVLHGILPRQFHQMATSPPRGPCPCKQSPGEGGVDRSTTGISFLPTWRRWTRSTARIS